MNLNYFWPALIALLFAAGCGMDGPAPSDSKPAPVVPQTASDAGSAKSPSQTQRTDAKPTAALGQPVSASAQASTVVETKPVDVKPAAAASSGSQPGMVREEAHVGMGEKGRGYGNGLIAVVAASFWSTKERLALMQIEDAVKKYKALNDGKGPKNHAEFMKNIIQENDIKLPVLPAGQDYEWDAENETLMIRKPPDPNGP